MKISKSAVFAAAALSCSMYAKESDTTKRLDSATVVLKEMLGAVDKGVPKELVEQAQCVVVIPGLKKAGFIVGAKYGKGFASCRKAGGAGWSAPAAMRIEGGSFGFQIGASETDVILIVKNKTGMQKLLQDKFTIGAGAEAAAGPIGRDLTAQTDLQMRAEMLSYSRSRGLFAGLTLSGATLREDSDDNTELYGHPVTDKEILTGGVPAPPEAAGFESALGRYSMRKTG
ncbi:MAG: lipid-binding SYLF domain-containing protein [Acidobacteriota bacterium]|nr:lipid-binding SYLF domain-containing protein [Acidobacteriota bacterium]